MNTLSNMMSYYNNSQNDVFHFVLGKIMSNIDLFLTGSIYDVAEYCSTSPATISRLSQKLGYKNYSDLKHNVYDAIHQYRYLNRIIPNDDIISEDLLTNSYFDILLGNIQRLRREINNEKINQIMELMHNSKSVRFYSFCSSFSELPLQINLMLDGKETILLQRFVEQIQDADKLEAGDFVVLIAPDNSDALDAVPLIDAIRKRGGKSLLITDSKLSMNCKSADYFFAFEGTKRAIDMHCIYMFIDILNVCYRMKYIDNSKLHY